MGPASLPLPDDIVAFGDEVGGPGEAEIRERLAEPQRELAHLVAPTQRRVQRVLEADVGRGKLVDDHWVEAVAPEIREPADDDCLVVPLTFYGSSFISDPYGRMLGQAPRDRPAVLVADLDLDQRRDWLTLFPFLDTRRPSEYAALVADRSSNRQV